MKYSLWLLIISAVFFGVVAGFAAIGLNYATTETEAQSALERNKGKDTQTSTLKPIVYPIETINGKFSLALPNSLKDEDWAAGLKVVPNGARQQMTIAHITWEKSPTEVFAGRVSKMENYPPDRIGGAPGQAVLGEIPDLDKKVIVWFEVTPGSEVIVTQKNRTFTLNGAGNLIINGQQFSENRLGNIAHLLGLYTSQKSIKELKEKGHEIIDRRKEGQQ